MSPVICIPFGEYSRSGQLKALVGAMSVFSKHYASCRKCLCTFTFGPIPETAGGPLVVALLADGPGEGRPGRSGTGSEVRMAVSAAARAAGPPGRRGGGGRPAAGA
jgi:hypothetical protein